MKKLFPILLLLVLGMTTKASFSNDIDDFPVVVQAIDYDGFEFEAVADFVDFGLDVADFAIEDPGFFEDRFYYEAYLFTDYSKVIDTVEPNEITEDFDLLNWRIGNDENRNCLTVESNSQEVNLVFYNLASEVRSRIIAS